MAAAALLMEEEDLFALSLFDAPERRRRCVYVRIVGPRGTRVDLAEVARQACADACAESGGESAAAPVLRSRRSSDGCFEAAVDAYAADADVDAVVERARSALAAACGRGAAVACLAHDCAVPLLPREAVARAWIGGGGGATARFALAAAAVRESGVAVVGRAIGSSTLDRLRDGVLASVACTRARLAALPAGTPARFREVMRRAAGRYDASLPDDSPAAAFADPARGGTAPWLGAVSALLGPGAGLRARGCVYSEPGAPAQPWHADQRHPRAKSDAFGGDGDWPDAPDAVCVFLPLVDLDEATGYTTFWPGSHRAHQDDLLRHGLPSLVPDRNVRAAAKAGDAILYDYAVVHRGEANASADLRPILYLVYGRDDFVDAGNFADACLP